MSGQEIGQINGKLEIDKYSPKKKKYINEIKTAWKNKPRPPEKCKHGNKCIVLLGERKVEKNVNEEADLLDDVDNGVFCIAFKDFNKYFEEVISAINFPPKWVGYRVFGKWTKENSGGRTSLPTWRINPAYKFSVPMDNTKIVISSKLNHLR